MAPIKKQKQRFEIATIPQNLLIVELAKEALEFCGFIDTVLGVIEQAQIHLDRV